MCEHCQRFSIHYLIHTTALGNRAYQCTHFADVENKAQRGYVICPKAQSGEVTELEFCVLMPTLPACNSLLCGTFCAWFLSRVRSGQPKIPGVQALGPGE